jgi:hypothetical protein
MTIQLSGLQLGNITGGPSSLNLSDLHDVLIVSPQDSQYLKYNSSTLEWQNVYITTDMYNFLNTNLTGSNGVNLTKLSGPQTVDISVALTATGDLSGSTSAGIFPLTLNNVNSTAGTFGSNSLIPIVTTNSKGLITHISTVSIAGTPVNNISGGAAGNIVYQSATNTTAFVTTGTSSQVLISGATPSWTNTPALSGANFVSIPNSALSNSSITVGSTAFSLGTTSTTLAGLTSVTSSTFVGALTGAASANLLKAGDTMAGYLILNGDPVSNLGAATKQYVDNVASGVIIYAACSTSTTAVLPACTYNNGLGGVGATLTANANGALGTVGGYAGLIVTSRVLVKDQATTLQNGIYVVSALGSGGSPWVLTRAADYDGSPVNEVKAGGITFIQNGTLSGTQWAETATGTGLPGNYIVVGTDPIVFSQFSGASSYTAGTGINISSNVISNTGVTSVVAGTNISVSSATGAVTIAITGSVPTATNIGAGATGNILYQSAVGATAFLATGTSSQVLVSGTTPSWTNTPTLTGTNFTGILNAGLTNSSVTIGSTSVSLGATATTLAGLTSVTSSSFTGPLTGNASNVTGIVLGDNGGTGVANTGKTISLAGNLTTSGAFNTTLTVTGATNITFPTSGTVVSSITALPGAVTGTPTSSTFLCGDGTWTIPAGAGGAGSVTSVSVVSANGLAGTVATATTTPAITISTTVTGLIKGNGTALSAATSGTDYSVGTSALATGILKSTTSTGALSIAVAADFPTLNQNTTGTAATATNIASGAAGNIVYQSASNTSAFLATGTSSQVLVSGTTPSWTNTPTLTGTNFTGIPNGALSNSSVTIGSTAISLGSSATTIAGLTSVTSTTFVGALTGNASNVTGIVTGTNGGTGVNNGSNTITLAGNLTTSGAFNSTLTTTGPTNVTLPTSGNILSSVTAVASVTGTPSSTTYLRGDGTWSSPGTVTSASVVSANGFAGSVATSTTTPAITISTTVAGVLKGNGTAISAATVGTDYSTGTSALVTGILKSTTSTGALSIAVAGDFPTLNQDTTGTAAIATNTTITNDISTATAVYPTWVTANTGNLPQKVSSTALSFVPSSGTLTATTFSGALSGTATRATNLASGVAGNIAYQTAANTTTFLTTGTSSQVLVSGTTPSWTNTPTLTGTNFTGIPNAGLTNSSVTIGSTSVSLGATASSISGLSTLAVTGAITTNSLTVGYLEIPQNSQSAAYTLVASDSGKHILHPSADTTARTFTIPANSSVGYALGTSITFINQNGAGVVTIAITSDTMRLAGAGTTGSRILAANGIATAVKITSTEWIISGTGLT